MVNQDLCIGCGTCEALCPSVFKLNQAGKAEVIRQDGAACAKNSAESLRQKQRGKLPGAGN